MPFIWATYSRPSGPNCSDVGLSTPAPASSDVPNAGSSGVAGALTVADRGTARVPPTPVCATRRVAVRVPPPLGRTATVSVVDSPGSRTTPLVSSNRSANIAASRPVIDVPVTVSGPVVPALVTTTSWVTVWRSGAGERSMPDGDGASTGGTAGPAATISTALTAGLPTPGRNPTSIVPSDTVAADRTSPRSAPTRAKVSTSRNAVRPSTTTSNTRPPTTCDGPYISARYTRTCTAVPAGTGKAYARFGGAGAS